MTPSRTNNTRLLQIGLLAALASVLQLAESCIPMPVPGMKIGFANLVTLIAIVALGARSGIYVAALRTLVSSLMLGTFLSSGFILSASGALSSALVMGALYAFNRRVNLFSLMGISIAGAVANNLAQIAVVYYLFARVSALQWFIPYLLLSAIVTGYLTGFLAARVCRKLGRSGKTIGLFAAKPADGSARPGARAWSVASLVKLAAVGAGFGASLAVSDPGILLALAGAALTAAMVLLKTGGRELYARFRRLFPYMIFIFAVNALGRAGGHGVHSGLVACLRLADLLLLAFLADKSIPRPELLHLLSKLLLPIELLGVRSRRLLNQVSFSLDAVPFFAKAAGDRFRKFAARSGKRKTLKYAAAFAVATLVVLLTVKGESDVPFTI